MATINKKPTKAHKNKKVVKAHQGMAHIPRQRPASPIEKKTRARRLDRARRAVNLINERTRGPIAPRPQAPTIQQPKPVRQPAVIKPARPTPIQSDAGGGRGQAINIRQPYTPRKLTSREKRRRDNFFKSEADEMLRQSSKRRRRRLPRIATEQPRVAMPYNPAVDNFPIGKPNTTVVRGLGPLRNNFNPQQSTALTDRFTKQQQELVQAQNKNNLNQNRLQMQRNKGGDVKKYATGGLNKGMTKSRTKYGTVDNKKK